tara:strand:+ start:11007 stop:12071 length:1065 start_codon:yes stop_codon:yes gene_type:complete
MTAGYRLHGLKLSYFTGKLEAYLRAKGIPFEFVGMDMADFNACGRATGIRQMPQLECPDGSWLTDTTAIMAHFETAMPEPPLQPADPATRFLSLLLEDMFDEWLWRPALYYRWAFRQDADLMSRQIARTLMRDLPGPLWLRQGFIRHRQRRQFLTLDGVTRKTAPAIEALYLETLDALEPIFANRPFLFGARPCAADFGLFGPFFRHFSHDPTPLAILRERAPQTQAWVSRMWALRPEALAQAAQLTQTPADLTPLFAIAADEYLPYLAANARAVAAGEPQVHYSSRDVDWKIPAAPYRLDCLNELKAGFAKLDETGRDTVCGFLGDAAEALAQPASKVSIRSDRPRDRLGNPA